MSSQLADTSSGNSIKRQFCGASRDIHQNTFRGLPLSLPSTKHRVQMKHFRGVELLLVHLDGEQEPYCSLRHLEATLRQSDLVAYMKNFGIQLKTIAVKDTGILPDIIKLRSGILEREPVLIRWQAVECILKRIGLNFPTSEADAGVEDSQRSSTVAPGTS